MTKAKAGKPITRWAVAAKISIIYALVAGAWIYICDALIAWLTRYPQDPVMIQTYKGWLFVGVTALLLYGLIGNFLTAEREKRPPELALDSVHQPGTENYPPLSWRKARTPILIFLLLAGAIGTMGYLVYGHLKTALQQEKQAELLAIADSKVNEVTYWLAERRKDSELLGRDPFATAEIRRWFSAGAPADNSRDRLLAWLATLKDTFDYSAVMLIDAKGQVQLGVGASQIHPKRQTIVIQAMRNGQVMMTDLHRRHEAPDGKIDIDLIAPLGIGSAGEAQPVGALFFKIDPEQYLFPLIQNWPTPSPSAETLLVRREGDEVLYLNELRHRKNTALTLRLPSSDERLAAAMAVRGETGVVEGVDYRQVQVLGAARAVPGTAWFMIAKVDRDEVYALIRTTALLMAVLASIFITAAGAGIGLWWRQQHTRFLADYYRSEFQRQALIQHFDYLAKYANDIILLMDGQGRIIEANTKAESAYGYTREELLNLNIRELSDPETPLSISGQTQQSTGTDGLVFETVQLRKDKSRFSAEISSRLIEIKGKEFLHSIIRDISERKRAEEALRKSEAYLRAIVNAVPDVLLVLDEDGRYLDILTSQSQLLHTDSESLKGKLMSGVLPPEVAERALAAIREALATRQPQLIEYKLGISKIGQRHYEARFASIEGSGLAKPAVVVVAHDITERKLTEEKLRQAQKMEAIGQLTGGVAHDFNNLLAIILANLELLDEELTGNPDLRDYLRRAFDAVERGANLTRRLLAFSRRQPLQPKPTNLNTLVARMTDLLRRTLGELIQVETILADDLRLTVIDPTELENALLNLALNARDAMPNGGCLTIETANRWLDEDYAGAQRYFVQTGQYVMLAVSDNGTGMAPKVLEHAFEPFFTTKDVGKGSGLGLSMVYGLVKQSGGYINIYSEIGKGTTIRIYLQQAKAGATAPSEAKDSDAPLYSGHGEAILVVEDNARVRQIAVDMLRNLGYHTLEADSAKTALKRLEENPSIALLFTDVILPGEMSGAGLACEARRRLPGLRVLFTSGYPKKVLINHARLEESMEFLAKPYRKVNLASKLHEVLGSHP